MPCIQTRYGAIDVPEEQDTISNFLRRYGEWALLEARFLSSVIEDGARIADIGAYIGTFGLGLGLFRKLDHVCFVEPNTRVFPMLQKNVTRNSGFPYAVVAAAIASSGFHPLAPSSVAGNQGAFSLLRKLDGPQEALRDPEIRLITLADLRERFGPFSLIKIDVEGMEKVVVESDLEWISAHRPMLWLECNEDAKSLEALTLLRELGYSVHYFAFNSHNPENFHEDPDPIYPFAFEAGLLAHAGHPMPPLDGILASSGAILKPIGSCEELREALWETPRWGRAEWLNKDLFRLVALFGRELQGQNFSTFLKEEAPVFAAGPQVAEVEAALARTEELARSRLARIEATERQLAETQAGLAIAEQLAFSRLEEIEAAERRAVELSAALARTEELARSRLAQSEATERQLAETQSALAIAEQLAFSRLERIEAAEKP